MFTDGRTDGRTPDRPVYYKLTLSLRPKAQGELKNSQIITRKCTSVLRLRGSICHMRGFIFTNARKIYYYLRVSIVRFLITFTGNLDI